MLLRQFGRRASGQTGLAIWTAGPEGRQRRPTTSRGFHTFHFNPNQFPEFIHTSGSPTGQQIQGNIRTTDYGISERKSHGSNFSRQEARGYQDTLSGGIP